MDLANNPDSYHIYPINTNYGDNRTLIEKK